MPSFCLGASTSASKHVYNIGSDKVLFLSDSDLIISNTAFDNQNVFPLDLPPASSVTHTYLLPSSPTSYIFALYSNPTITIISISLRSTDFIPTIEATISCPDLSLLSLSPSTSLIITLQSNNTLGLYDWSSSSLLQAFPLDLDQPNSCVCSSVPSEAEMDNAFVLSITTNSLVKCFLVEQVEFKEFRICQVNHSFDYTGSVHLLSATSTEILLLSEGKLSIMNPFDGRIDHLLEIMLNSNYKLSDVTCISEQGFYLLNLINNSESLDPFVEVLVFDINSKSVESLRKVFFVTETSFAENIDPSDDKITVDDVMIGRTSDSKPIIFDCCILNLSYQDIPLDPHYLRHASSNLIVSASFSETADFSSLIMIKSLATTPNVATKIEKPKPFRINSVLNSFDVSNRSKSHDSGLLVTSPTSPLSPFTNHFYHVLGSNLVSWSLSNLFPLPHKTMFHLFDQAIRSIDSNRTVDATVNASTVRPAVHPTGLYCAWPAENTTKVILRPTSLFGIHSINIPDPIAIPSKLLKFSKRGHYLACSCGLSSIRHSTAFLSEAKVQLPGDLLDGSIFLSFFPVFGKKDNKVFVLVPERPEDNKEISQIGKVLDFEFGHSDLFLLSLHSNNLIRTWDLSGIENSSNWCNFFPSNSTSVNKILNKGGELELISIELVKPPPCLRALSSTIQKFKKFKSNFEDETNLVLLLEKNSLIVSTFPSFTLLSHLEFTDHTFTTMSINELIDGDSRVVLGTESGYVFVFTLGELIQSDTSSSDFTSEVGGADHPISTLKGHSQAVSSIVQLNNPNSHYILSMSRNGHFKSFSLPHMYDTSVSKINSLDSMVLSDVEFISNCVLEPKALNRTLGEMNIHQDFKLRQISVDFLNKLTSRTQGLTAQISEKRKSYSELLKKIEELKENNSLELDELDHSQAHEVDEIRSSYAIVRESRSNQLKNLENEKRQLITSSEEELKRLEADQADELLKHQEEHSQHLKELSLRLEQLSEELSSNEQTFNERLKQCQEDGEAELNSLRSRLSEQLSAEREKLTRLRAERAMLVKKIAQIKRGVDDRVVDIQSMQRHDESLQSTIVTLEQERRAAIARMKERDRVIGEKEAKIFDLKVDNQELDKWKFVLDHQICELRGQIDPKLKEIHQLSVKIQSLFDSLSSSHKINHSMALDISKAKEELAETQKAAKKAYVELLDLERLKERLLTAITKASQTAHSDVALKRFIIKEIKPLVHTTGLSHDSGRENSNLVHDQQKGHINKLTRDAFDLKKELASMEEEHRHTLSGLVTENLELIRAIDELRNKLTSEKQVAKAKDEARSSSKLEQTVNSQRELIGKLRSRLTELTGNPIYETSRISDRPTSREVLPSLL
ncbi:hypothetical protein P9112_006599 [Eukaryota sp. TZLM1-RC]